MGVAITAHDGGNACTSSISIFRSCSSTPLRRQRQSPSQKRLTRKQSGNVLMAEKLSPPFVLERRFSAPRELVYAALTEAEHLGQWMSPPGMEMTQCPVDARVGGIFHYALKPRRVADAAAMGRELTFRELVSAQRIVAACNSAMRMAASRGIESGTVVSIYAVDHDITRRPRTNADAPRMARVRGQRGRRKRLHQFARRHGTRRGRDYASAGSSLAQGSHEPVIRAMPFGLTPAEADCVNT
jgi:Activator of Hsp90 ATPase homolog 1-like protein